MKLKVHNTIFELIEHRKDFNLSISMRGDIKVSTIDKVDEKGLQTTLLIAELQKLCATFKIKLVGLDFLYIINILRNGEK